MLKRAHIGLSPEGPIFRVAPEGVDVDAAAPEQLIAHEDFIFAQPFASGFVACPFAGYVGKVVQDMSVTVLVPDIGTVPIIRYYIAYGGAIAFPTVASEGAGTSETAYPITTWLVWVDVSVPGQLTVRFRKAGDSRISPAGIYYMLMRSADV